MARSIGRPLLRFLCVGAGRDGTLSLTHMIRELFERQGAGRQVAHEYASRAFFEASVVSCEQGERAGLRAALALIRECPYDAIVGNGYAPWLPLFAKLCGPDLVVTHLRRRDREACVRSLVDNATFFPAAYGYYCTSPAAASRRPAAFHYREMSRGAWDTLPMTEKLGWYYDNTHALVERHAGRFAAHYDIDTESLDDEATLRRIGEMILGERGAFAKPVHLNSQVHVADLPPDRRDKIQWLMGRLDVRAAANDELYPLEYFTNAFVAWTGYQIRRSEHIGPQDYRSAQALQDLLDRAAVVLDRTSFLLDLLKAELAEATDRLMGDGANGS